MSASPQQMQEKLKRWPLVAQPSNRSQSFLKDARLVNCFAEQDPNTGEYQVQKRPGYLLDYVTGSLSYGANGLWAFSQAGTNPDLYAVCTTRPFPSPECSMYKNGALFGSLGGLDGQVYGQNYFFVEDQAAAPNRHLIFASGFNVFWTIGTGGYTRAATPQPGGATIQGLAYLDQTTYMMDSECNIWGSDFNDPTTWNGANVVIANAIPGYAVQLTQQLNYIIALKSNSFEVFYDAGNATGSPLSPVAGALSNYGGILGSVQTIDDVLLYVTANRTVSPQIVRVDNLQITVISTPAIEKLLEPVLNTTNLYPFLRSWSLKRGGHRYCGWTYFGGSSGFTLVYDIDQKLWCQWGDQNSNFWPPTAMSPGPGGIHATQIAGGIYYIDGDYTYPTDNGIVVPVDIYTPNADFGTRRRKTLDRMYIQSDQTPGSLLYISRSDDDYQHWSTPRKVNLGRKTPYIDNEGTFIRRAYHFQHKAPTAFRIRSADLQMRLGTI